MQEVIATNISEKLQAKTKKEIIGINRKDSQYSGKNTDTRRNIIAPLAAAFSQPRLDRITPKTYLEILEQSGILFNDKSIAEMKAGILDLWQCIIFSEKGFTMPGLNEDEPLSAAVRFLMESFDKIKHPESEYEISYNNDSNTNQYYFRE